MRQILLIFFSLLSGYSFGQLNCSFDGITMNGVINGKNAEFYLSRSDIDQVSKDFYNGKHELSDDEKTFAIMDSISTSNSITRPFYLYNYFNIVLKADGALAESVGDPLITYSKKFPSDFVCFFEQERYKGYEDKLLSYMGYSLYQENFHADLIKEQMNNCIDCSEAIIERLTQLHKQLEQYLEY